ncbi:MAG TPA: hypothetical protein VGR70_11385 [Stellaceae bacterium]|nr:hypothetical protein [Stellaceae bacterium]
MTSDVTLALLGGGRFVIDGSAAFAIVVGGAHAVIANGAFAAVCPVPPI